MADVIPLTRHQKYYRSEQGNAVRKAYATTPKHKAAIKRWQNSPKGKAKAVKDQIVRHKKLLPLLQALVNDYKNYHPCMDCHQLFTGHPYVMDFDHRDPTLKIREVSWMVQRTRSLESIWAEIQKCDLVCANCHRIRTHGKEI